VSSITTIYWNHSRTFNSLHVVWKKLESTKNLWAISKIYKIN